MTEGRRRRNLESSTLVWLTVNPNQGTIDRLRKVIDYVQVFDHVDACEKYLEHVGDDEHTYIIAEIPYISNRARVYFHETQGEVDNFDAVLQTVETDHNAQVDPLGMNIFKQSTHSQLNSEFLWFQHVLSILFDSQDREKAKVHFLDIYKRYFDGNRQKEEKIQEFENTYQSENALDWYTRECFFFEILNKALRTQDIDVLFSLRFFLKDIFDQLKIEYEKTSHEIDMTVYRGQTISTKELQLIRENVGQLISLNSFISTTLEQHVATGFSLGGDPSGERVLFHINVNKSVTYTKPFADISAHSQFEQEKEILFMAGSIFEIESATFRDSTNMWMIGLRLCEDNVYELNDVYQMDKTIESDKKSVFAFGTLLLRMNLFDQSEKFYQRLLEDGSMSDSSSTNLITNCYWGLSDVARKRGDSDIALAYYRLAIEQCQDQPELLLRSYKYISTMYLEIHSIPEALEYQTKALDIQQKINDNKDQIADTLFNLGTIYFCQLIPETNRALDSFSQALNVYMELNLHEDLIRCYDAIGEVYLAKKNKEAALKYFLKALQVIEEYFSSYLPFRINSLEHIAKAYESMHDYEQATKYYDEALNAKLKYEPINDPNIAQSYESIGGLYHKKGDYTKAIEMYNKAIEFRQRFQPAAHPDIESIVYTRNALQQYTEDHPGEAFEYDSSSEDEPTFHSFQDALAHLKTQMETDQNND